LNWRAEAHNWKAKEMAMNQSLSIAVRKPAIMIPCGGV
jgi:hypothetical protein